MKKGLVALTAILLATVAYAQQEIKIEDAGKHVGDSVKICSKIFGGKFLDRAKDSPTLLNVGDSYPNNPLTLVIWADARKDFKNPPEDFYKGKQVCITGKIILFKEKPEIVLYSESQLTAVE